MLFLSLVVALENQTLSEIVSIGLLNKEDFILTNFKVIKKDGTLEDFNTQKIIEAVNKSAGRDNFNFKDSDYQLICNAVLAEIEEEDFENNEVSVDFIHNVVEKTLLNNFPSVGRQYQQYRNYKLDFVHMMDKVYEESQKIMYIGDKENSNTDSALVSTKRSLVFNKLNEELYKKFFLTLEERQAINDGYIKIHDMVARRDSMNCCLFDIKEVLTGGFEMGNIWYNEPKTLDVAFDVIGDITLMAASQQYGGFTLPRVDEVLAPYAEKSYSNYLSKYTNECHMDTGEAEIMAYKDVEKEMEQGYQGWEYKFNTVASSRGDYPFTTITFGLGTGKWEKLATKTFLRVRREGQGKTGNKKPVLFPKLVFLYTKDLHDEGKINNDLFKEGVKTSAKTMYPDWLSLDGDTTISKMYHKHGEVVSPMGKCKSAHVKRYLTVA